jgi:hypothetical protein
VVSHQAASDGSIAALLGIAGVHLALAAGYRSGLGELGRVPVVDLTVTAVGLPSRCRQACSAALTLGPLLAPGGSSWVTRPLAPTKGRTG